MNRMGRLAKRPSWIRDFQLLMAGSFVSMLGSRISTIAFPLLALSLTNSPFDAGMVAFAATVPSVLVYIPAGALVDRLDSRHAMLVCEFGRGVALTVVTISLVIGKPSIVLLIPIVIVEEILEVFSTLADRRCVRDLVPKDRASSAQAGIETKTHVVVLMGRPLGAFLFGLNPIFPFLADAASFVVSVLSIVNLKPRDAINTAPSRISRKHLGEDIITALKLLLDDGYARAALTFSAATTLIGQALIMIFLVGARTSGLSLAGFGLVLAASGVGGVLGAVSAPLFRRPRKASLVLLQMLAWAAALFFLAVWGWRSFYSMGAVMAMLSLTGALGNIEIDTYLVQSFNENMLARVTSFGRLISFSASAIGPVLGGMLIQLCKTHVAVLVLLAITLVLATLACLTPSMRNRQAVALPAAAVLRLLQESAVSLCRQAARPFMAAAAVLARHGASAVGSWRPRRKSLSSAGLAYTASPLDGASSRPGTAAGAARPELIGHVVARRIGSQPAGHKVAPPGASPTTGYRRVDLRQTPSDTKMRRLLVDTCLSWPSGMDFAPNVAIGNHVRLDLRDGSAGALWSARPRQEAFTGAFGHAFANAVGRATSWQYADDLAINGLVGMSNYTQNPTAGRRADALADLSPWLAGGVNGRSAMVPEGIWSGKDVVPGLLAGMHQNPPLIVLMDAFDELDGITNPTDLETVRYAGPASLAEVIRRTVRYGNVDQARVSSSFAARVLANAEVGRSALSDLAGPAWQAVLPRQAGLAIRQDLEGRMPGDAGRMIRLFRLLACGQGTGLPWADIWVMLAAALASRFLFVADPMARLDAPTLAVSGQTGRSRSDSGQEVGDRVQEDGGSDRPARLVALEPSFRMPARPRRSESVSVADWVLGQCA